MLLYFDDISVYGSTKEDCRKNLYDCVSRDYVNQLTSEQRKLFILPKWIECLGHIIQHNKIFKPLDKVAAILDVPRPKNVEELKRFLGT